MRWCSFQPHERTAWAMFHHRKENAVLDLLFVALTVICFSLVALLGQGADRL